MTDSIDLHQDATAIAHAVRSGGATARAFTEAALDAVRNFDGRLNCFTKVLEAEALAAADRVDARVRSGEDVGPLAGVPFAVKNLFDIAGVTTIAGSKIHAEHPVAARDSAVVERLRAAGAILIGATNMDEYAYGFVTENAHYGATHNPHDTERVAGGSSGGSAAAVAAGMVPLSVGSDTNGSIRVPASFCGIFGLKATYGRISRAGAVLFSESLDHAGPFARSVRDIALTFDVLHGPDVRDPAASTRPKEPVSREIERGADGLRIAVAGGYFSHGGAAQAVAAVKKIATALNVTETIEIPGAAAARAAAYVITACEGGALHLDDLRKRPEDFDPATVERFLAGALLPAAWYQHAQRFRRIFRDSVQEIFSKVDVLLAPTTPYPAIKIGQATINIDGKEILSRPNLGLFTQPLSFIGLPVVSVPVQEPGGLPIGVQVIGAPYKEAAILRVARELERAGVVAAPVVASGEI